MIERESTERHHYRSGDGSRCRRRILDGRTCHRAGRTSGAHRRRQTQLQRHLAGAQHRELRHPLAQRESRAGVSSRARSCRCPAAPVARVRRGRRGARRRGRGRRRRDSVSARSRREAEEEPGELARRRSGDQVLPARRAARQLHAVPVSDPAERQGDLLRVRIRGRGAQHLHDRSRARAGGFVDGAVGRQVGRRHARHHRHRPERSDVVRSRRQSSQRKDESDRALYAAGSGSHLVRSHHRRSADVQPPLEDPDAALSAHQPGCAAQSVQVRRVRRRVVVRQVPQDAAFSRDDRL